MKYYNLYYRDSKINNRPITEEDLELIKKTNQISKRNMITGKLEVIPSNKIKVVKTILI
jgi:hypothetical protein